MLRKPNKILKLYHSGERRARSAGGLRRALRTICDGLFHRFENKFLRTLSADRKQQVEINVNLAVWLEILT